MRRTALLVGIAVFASALYACDSASSSGGGIAQDASTDAPNDEGTVCCLPDPEPRCCMAFGGASRGSSCGKRCDGMPVASDPDWKIVNDAFGCPRWTNPHDDFNGGTFSAATSYCGREPPEDDAGSNDASDASDASDAAD